MSDDLERMIDEHGLQAVLDALTDICWGKAEHLRTNWQDAASAKGWDRAALGLGRVHAPS